MFHPIHNITVSDLGGNRQYDLWIQTKVRANHVTVNLQQSTLIINHNIPKQDMAQIGLAFLAMAGTVMDTEFKIDTTKLVESLVNNFTTDDIRVLRQTLADVFDKTS